MLCVLCPLPLNSSPMCCSNETGGVSITAKNAISFSPVSSWLLLISVLPIIYPAHRLHLISYSHRPLILLEMSPVDRDPRSILRRDILTLLMVSRRSTKIFPPFYSNESACGEGHCADQCTNLNNLSPAARVSNTVSWRDYTVSSFFFPACQACGTHGENRSLLSGWWQEPQCPAFGLHAAGIRRDEPDGWYPGSELWKLTAMACTLQWAAKCHNLLTASR